MKILNPFKRKPTGDRLNIVFAFQPKGYQCHELYVKVWAIVRNTGKQPEQAFQEEVKRLYPNSPCTWATWGELKKFHNHVPDADSEN